MAAAAARRAARARHQNQPWIGCSATSLFLALDLDWKFKTSKKSTIISAFTLGLVLEIIQGSFLSYRSFELYDILANTLGIVLFIFLSKRVKKLFLLKLF